jgi:hypothetical protein
MAIYDLVRASNQMFLVFLCMCNHHAEDDRLKFVHNTVSQTQLQACGSAPQLGKVLTKIITH